MEDIINRIENGSKAIQMLMDGYGKTGISDYIKSLLSESLKDEIEVPEDPVMELLLSKRNFVEEIILNEPAQDIPTLKKRIKYCKNPMEKKMLGKELNALYKARKRR